MALSSDAVLGAVMKSPTVRLLTLVGSVCLALGAAWSRDKETSKELTTLKEEQAKDMEHHADDRVHFQSIDDKLTHLSEGQDEIREMVREMNRRGQK